MCSARFLHGSALVLSWLAGCTFAPRTELRLGTAEDGTPTAAWRAAVEAHTGSRPEWVRRPLGREEAAWLALVRARSEDWEARIPELCVPFEGVHPPRTLTILVGNPSTSLGYGP